MSIRGILKQSRYPGTYREGWLGGDNVQKINNIRELTGFFADWTGESRYALYDDLHVVTEYRGAYTPIWAFLVGLWYALVERVRYFKAPGIYAKIWLPRNLGLDLYLVARSRVSPLAGNFYAHFKVETVDRSLFEEFCTDEFKDTLIELASSFQIRMNDNFIQIGPFAGTPEDSAKALDRLVTSVPRPKSTVAPAPDYFAAVEKDDGAVVIRVASGPLEADLWSSMLLSEGIPCTAIGYEQSRLWGNTPGFGVKILVPKSYAEQADKLLSSEP